MSLLALAVTGQVANRKCALRTPPLPGVAQSKLPRPRAIDGQALIAPTVPPSGKGSSRRATTVSPPSGALTTRCSRVVRSG